MMSDSNPSHPDLVVPRVSYAQNREDILLDRLFGEYVGRYMDVGSCHPVLDSNTHFFYERGWRGVNLEPRVSSFHRFLDQRPEDLNLNLAASDFDGELLFYEVDDDGLSTVSAEIAQGYRQRGVAVVERQVPVRTIRSLIDSYGIEPPDLLSIDVEGHEAAVIRETPLDSWRPRVLVVEATLPLTTTPSHHDWEPILLEQGYVFAAFNGVNRFYLRDDLRELLDRLATPVNVLDHFVPYEVVVQQEHAANLQRRLACEQDRLAVERQQHEQFHRTWERDQAVWETERRATERERAVWQARLTTFETERAVWQDRLTAFEAERAVWLARLTSFEAERAQWQARLTAFEAERAVWQNRLTASEAERAQWHTRLTAFEAERVVWLARLTSFEAERAQWQARLSAIEAERAEWARRRMALEQNVACLQGQLEATQRQLRPYRLVDRLGVVTVSYGWARKLKHRLVS